MERAKLLKRSLVILAVVLISDVHSFANMKEKPQEGERAGNERNDDLIEVYSLSIPDSGSVDSAGLQSGVQELPSALLARIDAPSLYKRFIEDGEKFWPGFTPRTGRQTFEEVNCEMGSRGGSTRCIQDTKKLESYLSQRSPPFAPRLGRSSIPHWLRLIV